MTQPPPLEHRDISWLAYNGRILAEGRNPENPLLERAKFLSIACANLDEFFMVRIARMERRTRQGADRADASGKDREALAARLREEARRQREELSLACLTELFPGLSEHGLRLLDAAALDQGDLEQFSAFFEKEIRPVLAPRLILPGRPAPLLAARRLYLAVRLQGPAAGGARMGIVPIPAVLERVVLLPREEGGWRGVLLEQLIALHAPVLFPGAGIRSVFPFRVTRDEDFTQVTGGRENIVSETDRNVKKRRFGRVVRIEVPEGADGPLLRRLTGMVRGGRDLVQAVSGPIDLGFLRGQLYPLPGMDALRFPPFEPRSDARLAGPGSLFRILKEGDLFFHHPYDSFEPVLRFLREAASDPRVLAVKQTLYRLSGKSPLIPLLARAARNGKQVSVLVEVRARFDEKRNLSWGRVLEQAGCQVLYGYPQWKTHSKITLVVRREGEGLARYVHIGTGNYNDMTARAYTDMGLLTCDPGIGEDAAAFFGMLTGYSLTRPFRHLVASPAGLRPQLLSLIERERANALSGKPAAITLKVNALSDRGIIAALYDAACAGVRVHLLVRGICRIRPDPAGRISIRSIVGRFLEHTRVFVFHNEGQQAVYLSSADLMPRNLDRRIELAAPVLDRAVREKILGILALELSDNRKAWEMDVRGVYERCPSRGAPLNSQEALLNGRLSFLDTPMDPPL